MYIFKIHGKEYKVRFTYRQLCKDDLLDRVTSATFDDVEDTAKAVFGRLVKNTAELLLAGLQKYHGKEFGYKTNEEKEVRIEELIDWFDDYEDESTEDHPQSAFTLYEDMQEELGKNGFLSTLLRRGQEMMEQEMKAQETPAETPEEKVIEMPTTPTETE